MILDLEGPFDLSLSLEAAACFYPLDEAPQRYLRRAVRTPADVAIVEVRQLRREPPRLGAKARGGLHGRQLAALTLRLACADLDLRPFYRLAREDPIMGPLTASLHGLKPLQPATVFESAVIAITEQQLSMAAAYRIRSRLVRHFGESVGDLWVFPGPEAFLHGSDRELAGCGLSRQKAGYLKALARSIADGGIDLESLRAESDDAIRARLLGCHGFGRWSVEHVLLHGFGRPGALPATDVSLQKVVGHYLAAGRRLTAEGAERVLSRFRPFHGLAAFYLSVAYRRPPPGGSAAFEKRR